MWVQMSDTNINTKPIVLCRPPSGTVILTQKTIDTMCTSGTITDATLGGEKSLKNYIKKHCRKIYIWTYSKNCYICKKYISNTIFTYENIYRCININFTYSLHAIKKL